MDKVRKWFCSLTKDERINALSIVDKKVSHVQCLPKHFLYRHQEVQLILRMNQTRHSFRGFFYAGSFLVVETRIICLSRGRLESLGTRGSDVSWIGRCDPWLLNILAEHSAPARKHARVRNNTKEAKVFSQLLEWLPVVPDSSADAAAVKNLAERDFGYLTNPPSVTGSPCHRE